ncbi:glycosyltransferase family 2 protein [Shouchella shacheensis]|uniref:glycosyltransferase family 2 protein n=1 Tax=Shouchella shacheensis TaxID=1649580 RepID=UPI000740513C|nr:glycosyltransferase family 2 protein [Shouchella shacheensis]
MSQVSVVIPALNEEDRIAATIHSVRTLPYDLEVLCINDGSSDRTGEVAEQEADRTFHLSQNEGKGYALQHGWRETKGMYIVSLDADLGESAAEAVRLLEPLMAKKADMTISKFRKRQQGGYGFVKRRTQRLIFNQTGHWLEAPLSGQRAFHRHWLKLLLSTSYYRFSVEVGMSLDMLRAGAQVVEVETEMAHREMGKSASAFHHRFKQWRDIKRYERELGRWSLFF